MLICHHCGTEDNLETDDHFRSFSLDKSESGLLKGFWCEDCDGYTYSNEVEKKHKFKLILEDELIGSAINNKTKKKLTKRISMYRYPGGKTRIINYLYNELLEMNTKKLVSPFTGGGSFELSMLEAGVIDELHMNDLDTGVYSLYWVIKHMPSDLIHRIRTARLNHKSYYDAQALIRNDYRHLNVFEAAWTSLLVNRLAYSGISKAGPLGGKRGSVNQLLSRWNPDDLVKRIEMIHSISHRYTISNMDAAELVEEYYWCEDTTIFIDPPYLLKGKDLYDQYYVKRDHVELATLLDSLHQGTPGADVIVTYDYHKYIEDIFETPNVEIINRKYSI